MKFFPIFTKGIKAKLNELESESDILPQNGGKDGKSELTPVVKALTNCAVVRLWAVLPSVSESFEMNWLLAPNLFSNQQFPPLKQFCLWVIARLKSNLGRAKQKLNKSTMRKMPLGLNA